jgi:general secretion pathway protein G
MARGFTLIELVMVLAVAGLLLAIAFPSAESYVKRSRVLQATAELGDMSKRIREFEIATGALPDDLADVGLAGKADPWGYPYQYFNLRNSRGNGKARNDRKLRPLNSDFELYSGGADGASPASLGHASSRDDVVRARNGGFVGTAEEYDP